MKNDANIDVEVLDIPEYIDQPEYVKNKNCKLYLTNNRLVLFNVAAFSTRFIIFMDF